jgi:hypothetical protein
MRKNEGGFWARRGSRLKKETMRLLFKAALQGENKGSCWKRRGTKCMTS